MQNKFINFRASPELVEGLDEVVEYLKANSLPGIRITKVDAFRYLINLFKEHKKSQAKKRK